MQVGDFSISFADNEMYLNRRKSLLPNKSNILRLSPFECGLVLETLLERPEFQEKALASLNNKKVIGIDGKYINQTP